MRSHFVLGNRVPTARLAFAIIALTIVSSVAAQGQRSGDTVRVKLDDLARSSLRHDSRLAAASADVETALSFITSARSPMDPSFSIVGDRSAVGGQLSGFLPTGGLYLLGSPSTSASAASKHALAASFSQPLLRGVGYGSLSAATQSAREGTAAARSRLTAFQDAVVTEVAIAYRVLTAQQRQEAIAARSLARAQELLAAYSELRTLGKITEVELNTARLAVASRRATMLAERRDRQNAQDALIFLAYGDVAAAALVGDDVTLAPTDTVLGLTDLPTLDTATARALRLRPDVAASRSVVTQLEQQRRYVRNSGLPTLDLSTAFTSSLVDSAKRVLSGSARQTDWTVGLVFSRPILNSASGADAQRIAASELRARYRLIDAENNARAEIRAAFRDIGLGRERMALATEAAGLARDAYAGERARLDLGLTDIFRVLQYEDQVAQVERAEAGAWLALATATDRYRGAIGGAAERYAR